MSPLLFAVLTSTAHAAGPVASLVVVDAPLPAVPADPALASGVCPVTWTVPFEGAVSSSVAASCPAELAPVVTEAAGRWIFAAVDPSRGDTRIEVARWFVLGSPEGQERAWSAVTSDPAQSPALPEDCIRAKRRVAPHYPPTGPYEPANETCEAWHHFHADGSVAQVEVQGCPNTAGLAVAEAAVQWTFRFCDAAEPMSLSWRTTYNFK